MSGERRDDWPFADPRNVAVFTTVDVLERGLPIVFVTHDADDGSWQFHSENGAPSDVAEARIVALEEIVALDSTVAGLADLPLGGRARRSGPQGPWQRTRRRRR